MALDTENKRASAIDVTTPWRGMLPIPDGTIGSGDRVQVGLMYRGEITDSEGGGGVVTTEPSYHHMLYTFGRSRSQPGMS